MFSRREMLGGMLALPALGLRLVDTFGSIEQRTGGRLGVAALDTASGTRLSHAGDARFPMCSTFKWLAVANVLARVDAGGERLERFVPYGPNDLLEYAPITRQHVGEGGMTLEALCAAAVTYSDNTAANLILAAIGGPAGFTSYVRSVGDTVTRLDRTEPSLNNSVPGDPRDTCSPAAMVADLQHLLVETRLLSGSARATLTAWLIANTTGGPKLRAGLPSSWRIGDKTGSGMAGSIQNDVAVAWPPGRSQPVLIAVYLTQSKVPEAESNRAIADAGRLVAETFGVH